MDKKWEDGTAKEWYETALVVLRQRNEWRAIALCLTVLLFLLK